MAIENELGEKHDSDYANEQQRIEGEQPVASGVEDFHWRDLCDGEPAREHHRIEQVEDSNVRIELTQMDHLHDRVPCIGEPCQVVRERVDGEPVVESDH